jgi:hypothetical protein
MRPIRSTLLLASISLMLPVPVFSQAAATNSF